MPPAPTSRAPGGPSGGPTPAPAPRPFGIRRLLVGLGVALVWAFALLVIAATLCLALLAAGFTGQPFPGGAVLFVALVAVLAVVTTIGLRRVARYGSPRLAVVAGLADAVVVGALALSFLPQHHTEPAAAVPLTFDAEHLDTGPEMRPPATEWPASPPAAWDGAAPVLVEEYSSEPLGVPAVPSSWRTEIEVAGLTVRVLASPSPTDARARLEATRADGSVAWRTARGSAFIVGLWTDGRTVIAAQRTLDHQREAFTGDVLDELYVKDTFLVGVDATSGTVRWRAHVTPHALLVAGDTVLVSDLDLVVALDAATGGDRWHARFGIAAAVEYRTAGTRLLVRVDDYQAGRAQPPRWGSVDLRTGRAG